MFAALQLPSFPEARRLPGTALLEDGQAEADLSQRGMRDGFWPFTNSGQPASGSSTPGGGGTSSGMAPAVELGAPDRLTEAHAASMEETLQRQVSWNDQLQAMNVALEPGVATVAPENPTVAHALNRRRRAKP